MIRFSHESDKEEIKSLIKLCFGDREKHGAYNNLNGRYLLYIVNNKIVAMTGLNCNTTYPSGVEVDWSCTHPDYRKKGYMHELFKRLVQLTDEDIYCSCWRVHDNKKVNLESLMKDFNFKCVCKSHISCNLYKCNCINHEQCINTKENCHCYEDLYIRESTNNA